ncbi:hypothetical protein [Duganella radicis]|uniref:Uncharacterized protein n=1 Tax=Duganella radicis TaxID=551988 RepID=A0A6L6PPQ2_9BURK|nr:hypothetical protein [Duganella radicis]MTV41098.1 hypothetical protein [Duganella radicis]
MSRDNDHNLVLNNMRRLDQKYQQINADQTDFMRRQSSGEQPDPDEFIKLLEQQSVTGSAMTAQFNLFQKPLKTALTDSR